VFGGAAVVVFGGAAVGMLVEVAVVVFGEVAAQAGVTLDVSDKPPLAPGVALPAEERV
jgi:hypothetical protein